MPQTTVLTTNSDAVNQQVLNPMVQVLQILFGRSARDIAMLKGQIQPQEKYSSIDSIEGRLSKIFTGYSDLQYDRHSKYRDYDRMDTASTEAQTGLDIFAEEASQKDDKTGLRAWVESEDKNLEQDLNGMLQRIRFEFKAYGIYRNLAKYGDCFMYTMLGGYGVHDIQYVHPARVERVQSDGLLGFKSVELATHLPVDNKQGMFKPWDFVHMRIMAYDTESVYGRAFLENIRKVWKQFSMLETMLVLYRIAKAVQRNIFYVDVGQASIQETQMLVKDYEKFLKNKQSFLDPKTNDFKLDFNPATILQDIIWPVRPNSTSKVEQLQNTTAIGPVDDLEHFRNKMRIGLNIPKDYFDGEVTGAWNSKEALILQDIRLSRKITKLQDAMREGLVKLCQIHYAVKNKKYLPPESFVVQLGTVSAVADRQREDILLRKAQIMEILANISVIMGWNRWVWGDYLLDEIFPLPAKLRNKLQTPDPVQEMEFEKSQQLAKTGKPGGKPGGGGKMNKPSKPPKKVTADNLRMGLRGFGYGEEDELNPNDMLVEEFQQVAEDAINNPDNIDNLISFLPKMGIREGDVVHNIISGYSQEEMDNFIAALNNNKVQNIIDSKEDRANINWKKLHEAGIPPNAFPEGKGYDDELDPSDEFSPEF